MGLRGRVLPALAFCALLMGLYAATSVAAPEGVAALLLLAEQGDVRAQVQLGIQYEHGEGVPKDPAQAMHFYCLAAEQGDTRAQYSLGWMYANGRGVGRDDALAAAWFRRAAEKGDAYAKRMLARLGNPQGDREVFCPGFELDRFGLPPGSLPQRRQIEKWVHELAPEFGLQPRLVLAVIAVESLFDAHVKSRKSALGLMQLIPETAERFGVQDVWDPVDNLKGGMAYLRWLLALFQGDLRLALAGYNAGEQAVEAHGGVPPYAETKAYVDRITRMFGSSRHPYLPGLVKPSRIVVELEAQGSGVDKPARAVPVRHKRGIDTRSAT
jgi:soluble lytic murein transglycosylase-like protein